MRAILRSGGMLFICSLLVMGALALAPSNAKAAAAAAAVNADTSTIQAQVQRKLATLPWYGVFDNLQYEVKGTEVILNGQVISEHDVTKNQAENAVRSIPGVTKVVNNIEVLPLSPFDNQIRRAEFRAIFSKSDLGRYTMGAIPSVHIIVRGGHVTLEGVVMNQMDKTVAGIAANTVPDVFSVKNDLRVGS